LKNGSSMLSNLNPNLTFNNFHITDFNSSAYKSALAAAKKPKDLYNPFFVYGKYGSGKTHLINAIGNYIVENSVLKVLYITSEYFLNKFIKDNINYSREKYLEVDVFIIDDIHFLAGADKTQQELLIIIDNHYRNNKQIIISSDRSSDDLKHIEKELEKIFTRGLAVEIK